MNWFQIVFLREQSQGVVADRKQLLSCELISNCIFTWAITSSNASTYVDTLLWIDFKLYFYVSNHKIECCKQCEDCVVNWFQIVFLREQSQVHLRKLFQLRSCELISNCIFTWAITSYKDSIVDAYKLWIDFKLYFYVSNHKKWRCNNRLCLVVNWFQIVFLREQSQVTEGVFPTVNCCELISNCIFTWAITRNHYNGL